MAFNAGLFDCFEPIEDCVIGYFAPCIIYGRTSERLLKNSNNEADHELVNNECIMFGVAACFGLHWVLNTLKRGEIRQRYNIEGSMVEDCALSWCCGCCAVIQQDKEVRQRLSSNVVTDGYQAQGMSAAPPQ